ncbi:acetamidase/formamidase family protein [Paraclostridium sordellii]|uniref:acetamidase/formamidase family protein n=1 Tax=Paraclostridium sordellii TaxID=1505 RepID=UPI00038585A5|nr:acetamidase/formamidase family protein [Paeniclostridium sordellii]EPZ61503.1 putative acetamidase/formamidase [[Clostridium] sordellii VPI 9048] [Paeniclostridium sordellii VPI 9048]CEK39730.1 putative acetamidase/formamidase [[Clostridium] sordellii] [Paeniclostridium sordellii]
MNIIRKENYTFTFSNSNKPVSFIKPGNNIVFETHDCMCSQISCETDNLDGIDFDKVNPATGPLYIEGAMPNQTLKVTVQSIDLDNYGIAMTGPGVGVLGEKLDKMTHNILNIKENSAIFKNIELPLNKMIGVIGVAPNSESINCGTPGSHGGNMDCKVIGEGSIVYLPIYIPGALLSVGDVHAVMGDGEIGVSGAEVGAKVDLKVDLISNFKINNPIVETYDAYYTIASAQTLDDAYKIAVEDMFEILLSKCSLNKNDLIMLMSLTCDIEVCQVVDPLKTIRYKIKKEILKKLNIDKLI